MRKEWTSPVRRFSKQLLKPGIKLLTRPVTLIAILVCLMVAVLSLGLSGAFHAKSRMTSFDMKDIGELATQAGYFTVVNSMDDSVKLWGWSVPLTASKYIFSYDGVVKAGLDFTQLEYSVDERKKEIKVSLPEIRILSVEILEDSLEIYDEVHNIFTPLELADIHESRLSMIDEIRAKALDNGLLDQATENAKALVKGFLSGSYDQNEYQFLFES